LLSQDTAHPQVNQIQGNGAGKNGVLAAVAVMNAGWMSKNTRRGWQGDRKK